MDPRIADFIAKNHGKYTREAIRQQLIDAGHDPADIDATWAMLFTPDPDEEAVAGEGFWPRFFLFLIGLNLAVFLAVLLSTGMLGNMAAGGGVLAGIFAVALGIGALIAWGIVALVGPEKLGRTTALVVGGVIPLVFALLIGGSCFALVGSLGPPPLPAVPGEMELRIDEPFTFTASGSAICQPVRDSIGYSVYANEIGRIDGQPIYVSVDAYEERPGELTTNISISTVSETEAEFRAWFTTLETALEVDVPAGGLTGTVAFEGLTAETGEPVPGGTDGEAISGSIRWSCG
jgi:hypothetical protein